MRRILPIHCPVVRRTVGSSFGPMTIKATRAITRIWPQLNSIIVAQRPEVLVAVVAIGPVAISGGVRSVAIVIVVWWSRGCCYRAQRQSTNNRASGPSVVVPTVVAPADVGDRTMSSRFHDAGIGRYRGGNRRAPVPR